jgi:hypothetical protein
MASGTSLRYRSELRQPHLVDVGEDHFDGQVVQDIIGVHVDQVGNQARSLL